MSDAVGLSSTMTRRSVGSAMVRLQGRGATTAYPPRQLQEPPLRPLIHPEQDLDGVDTDLR